MRLASPLLQKRPPATPPSSPVVLTRRSHTPIRLNGSSATRRSSTPTCSVQAPLTPNIARSSSRGSYALHLRKYFENELL